MQRVGASTNATPSKRAASRITQFVALALVAVSLVAASRPSLRSDNPEQLARSFSFERVTLPINDIASKYEMRLRDEVSASLRPSLERARSWILATRAGCTTADLDRDGLPNDLLLSDSRLNAIIVMPVPGTGDRYAPFLLNPHPLDWDVESMSPSGSLVGDFNDDGNPDVLVVCWGRTPIVFLNQPDQLTGQFNAVFEPRELVPESGESKRQRWYSHAVTQADIDGDGHLDVIVGNFFQDNADVLNPNATGDAAVMQAGKSRAMNGGGARLLIRNPAIKGNSNEAFRFDDFSTSITDLTDFGWVLAAGAADFDLDGLPEIYLANDFGPDRILHNRSEPGAPRFAICEGRRYLTTPKSFALGDDSFKGMGVDFADLNSDGLFDVLVSNIGEKWALQESHFVWLSDGDTQAFTRQIAPFTQSSERLGLSRSGWGWDIRAADFNNDRVPEVLQATGFISGDINRWPELQALATGNERIMHDPQFWPRFQPGDDVSGHDPTPFYCMGQNGVYVDVASWLSLENPDQPMNSRGIAVDDVDGDGLLDFVVANQWSDSCFFRNMAQTENTHLTLHLVLPIDDEAATFWTRPSWPGPDTKGNPAIGAVVRIRGEDGTQAVTQADGGSGHTGRRSPTVHFGLGKTLREEQIEVAITWRNRSGQMESGQVRLLPGIHTIVLGRNAMESAE